MDVGHSFPFTRLATASVVGLFLLHACADDSNEDGNLSTQSTSTLSGGTSSASTSTGSSDSSSASTQDSSDGDTFPALPEAINAFGSCALTDKVYVFGGNVGAPHNESIETTRGDFRVLDLTQPN